MIHGREGSKPHRTQVTGMCHLSCLRAITSSAVPNQNFAPFSRVSLIKSKAKMSLLPRTPLFPHSFVPSLRLLSPLNQHRAGKGRKTQIFGVFWPFLQGQSWKQPGNLCKKKQVDGQRLCQTNSCCCSCWMYLPNKSWRIRESHLHRFSGIYVLRARCGAPGCDWDKLGIVRLEEQGANTIPWKSVQHCLRHCRSHLGDSALPPLHLFAGK